MNRLDKFEDILESYDGRKADYNKMTEPEAEKEQEIKYKLTKDSKCVICPRGLLMWAEVPLE